jgi:hypothetical protein
MEGSEAGLSPDLANMRARWQAAYNYLSSDFNSEKETAKLLVAQFNGISLSTAYKDIAAMKLIFGDIKVANESIERHFASEMAKDMFQMAKKWFESTKKATYFFAMVEQQKIHMKVNRLDKSEIEFPDMMDMPRQEHVIQLSPEFLKKYGSLIDQKVLQRMGKALNGKVFKDYLNDMSEDVAFTEVDDGSELDSAIKLLRKLHEKGVNIKEVTSTIKEEFDA